MEDITYVDYRHGKTAFEYLISKNLGDHHDCMFRVIHYYQQIYLKILEENVLKYTNLI